jgi:predicted amino acid racemase
VFLDVLRRRNPRFLEAIAALHQAGLLPANTVALDLDGVRANAAGIASEAERLGLEVFAMTKQIGRHPAALAAIRAGGIRSAVGVDLRGAQQAAAGGLAVGHLGHLVQIPRHEAAAAARLRPANWTVFSATKAEEASSAAVAEHVDVALLARVWSEGDHFYPGHEGGIELHHLERFVRSVERLPSVSVAGVTTFPALLFDPERRRVVPTPNLVTLARAADVLAGRTGGQVRVNAPGTTSTNTLAMLAEAGATQVEPGHGLTGTTPLHAVVDLPERPAVAYVTEVSHLHAGRAYCFGGGLYIDPVFAPYPVRALVVPEGAADEAFLVEAALPAADAIDYYATLTATGGRRIEPGWTVIFGFRVQAFVTRAFVAGVRGLDAGRPAVEAITDSQGTPVDWP